MDSIIDNNITPIISGIENFNPLNGRVFDGPLSKGMWETVSKLNSKYPDTFNYSVYDRLYKKFGDTQPRGGVLFKTPLKAVNFHSFPPSEPP